MKLRTQNYNFTIKEFLQKLYFCHFLRRAILKNNLRGVSEPCQKSKIELFVKIVHGNYFRKKLHLRCLTGF